MKSLASKVREIAEWLGPGTVNAMGRQFSGKDENLKRLAPFFGAPILSSGEVFRSMQLSPELKASMESGHLIDTSAFRSIILPLLETVAISEKPLFLSAVGRMKGEEPVITEATAAIGHPTRAVLHFEITRQESLKRMLANPRGRSDDTPEALARRLDEFDERTVPVLEAYDKESLLVPVNAMAPLEVVFNAMVEALHERSCVA